MRPILRGFSTAVRMAAFLPGELAAREQGVSPPGVQNFCVTETSPIQSAWINDDDDIQGFAQERGDTVAGVLRWSLGVGKVIWDEIKAGNMIRSADPEDSARRRDLIFSRY